MDLEDLYDDNNKLKVPLRRSLAENKKVLGILFENCGDVVQKSFAMERAEGMVYMHVVYIDGLTNNGMIEETILKPLSYEWRGNRRRMSGTASYIRRFRRRISRRKPPLIKPSVRF